MQSLFEILEKNVKIVWQNLIINAHFRLLSGELIIQLFNAGHSKIILFFNTKFWFFTAWKHSLRDTTSKFACRIWSWTYTKNKEHSHINILQNETLLFYFYMKDIRIILIKMVWKKLISQNIFLHRIDYFNLMFNWGISSKSYQVSPYKILYHCNNGYCTGTCN